MTTPAVDVLGWLRALCREVGGPTLYGAALDYFGGDASLAELAVQHGVPRSTLHGRLDRVWRALEREQAIPPTWRRRTPGRPGVSIYTTGKELFDPSELHGHFAIEGEDDE